MPTDPKKPAPTGADEISAAVAAARRPRMAVGEIGYMLAGVARVPAALAAAVDALDTDLFNRDEAHFVLFWRGVKAAVQAGRGTLPADPNAARELVALKCNGDVAADAAGLYYTAAVQQAVLGDGGLLDELFAVPIDTSKTGEDVVIGLLARFVNERKLVDPLRRALAETAAGETLADATTVFAAYEKHYRKIAGLAVDPGSAGVVDADDFRPPAPQLVTTKMRWLDDLIGGGQAAQECYALLGGTSGGKTACAVQIAMEGAELQASLAATIGADQAGYWYYFTWELNETQLRQRIYMYGARVHAETIFGNPPRPLSSADQPGSLHPYEADPYVNPPAHKPRGERERVRDLTKRMAGTNSRLQVVDYSGTYPGHGTGGVDEVTTYLRREQARGRRVAGLVIDYAGLAINRYIGANRMRPESEFSLLAGFVDQVRSSICVPMKCTGWVLHQLHGDAGRKAPGAKISHTEARGCRNFADNADFGLQLTPYNRTTGLLTVHCTKHRRAPGREDGVIVRFRGEYGAFVDPDQHYVVDPTTRQIVPRDYLDAPPAGPGGGAPPPAADRPRPYNPLDGI